MKKSFYFADEMILKNKKVNYPGVCLENTTETTLSQYTLINKHTKEEKIWSNDQKLALTNLLKEYPNGGALSEFLTCLQASIQVNCGRGEFFAIKYFYFFVSVDMRKFDVFRSRAFCERGSSEAAIGC